MPNRPPVTVEVPARLADALADWSDDRAACSAEEDTPGGKPWWADSDDQAAELVRQLHELVNSDQP